jgi:hypothetical protein
MIKALFYTVSVVVICSTFLVVGNRPGIDNTLILEPDDIVTPSRWLTYGPHSMPRRLVNYCFNEQTGMGFRNSCYYVPYNARKDRIELCILLHGTGGQENENFFEETNPVYRGCKRWAAGHATERNRYLEFLSFRWPGTMGNYLINGDEIRKEAGRFVVQMLQKSSIYRKANIALLGHSHGCNIANYITQLVDPERPIDLLIHFACPVREDYQPQHYNKLVHFYSDFDWTILQGDWVAIMGRINEAELKKALGIALGVGLITCLGAECIKARGSLATIQITNEIRNCILVITALVFGVYVVKLLKGSHKFPLSQDKEVIGISTCINGLNPDHSSIMDAACLLPQILDMVAETQEIDGITSGYFDLALCEDSVSLICKQSVGA